MLQKVWVFTLKDKLNQDISEDLSAEINGFLSSWDTHGTPVDGELEIIHDQVLVVRLISHNAIPSGCSKDKLDKAIRKACELHQVQILDESHIVVLDNEELKIFSRPQFKENLKSGSLPIDSLLLDYSVLAEEEASINTLFKPIIETWARNLITN